MSLRLFTKEEATEFVAYLAKDEAPLTLSIHEDICFNKGVWMEIGKVTFQQSAPRIRAEAEYNIHTAINHGGFQWEIPPQEVLVNNLKTATSEIEENQRSRVEKAFLQGLQDLVRRNLLLLPVFDLATVSQFPLSRPTTIVPDSNAVHQGGLDFVCRFLTPHARIKLPAIVHMEILNKVDGYFSLRRKANNNKARAAALENHIISQGGQRTLLRIELHSDAEIDRGDLGADPLRGIVTESSDPEDRNLGLQTIVRSFADRLIVETARRFREQVRPDHPLVILTSDQGMARMAMSEGLGVFFFQARAAPSCVGKTLTGALFHPFCSELYTVSWIDVLWEIAVSFGGARIKNELTQAYLEVWGIPRDNETSWQPLHAVDDLLWGVFIDGSGNALVAIPEEDFSPVDEKEPGRNGTPGILPTGESREASSVRQATKSLTGSYSFSPNKMLELIGALVATKGMKENDVMHLLGVENRDQYKRYENFLLSGELISKSADDLALTPKLITFWKALNERDLRAVIEVLDCVPSFRLFHDYIAKKKRVTEGSKGFPVPGRARSTYTTLAETAGICLVIPGIGIVSTESKPTQAEFTQIAKDCYDRLASQEKTEWVLTGRWLEKLAESNGIHPASVPQLLEECRTRRLLRPFVEGSTPDTRFDRHVMWLLTERNKKPAIERVYLYHGDFLTPNSSSVRLKIAGVE